MRKELEKIEGLRGRFEAVFVRYGSKKGYKGYPVPTLLLKEVKSVSTGEYVTDHLWFTCGKRFNALGLEEGDVMRFDARVTPYEKGYKGYRGDFDYRSLEYDYRLSFPTNLVKVDSGVEQEKLI